MPGREHFLNSMQELSLNVLKLGTYTEGAMQRALDALARQDVAAAAQIMEDDQKINNLQLAIEDQCVSLIAREQPVARDLREIVTTIKVASNLERIGDQAVHLAKATRRLAGKPFLRSIQDLQTMARIGIEMVHEAIDAFRAHDGARAREVARRDDRIDAIHDSLVQELLAVMHNDQQQIDMSTNLLFLCRFLERTGDHVVNICEWIVYAAEGVHADLNG